MKVTNNTGAPQFEMNWMNLCLMVLHVIVLLLSIVVHDVRTPVVAAGALSQAVEINCQKDA
jgi:hypothetical protein